MAKVTIYTKTGCPYCAAAKEDYSRRGIDFEEKNVHANKAWLDELLQHSGGERKVPVIVDAGKVTIGFNGY